MGDLQAALHSFEVFASGTEGLDVRCCLFLRAWFLVTAVVCTWFHGAG